MDVPLKKNFIGKRPKKKRFQGNMYRKKSMSEEEVLFLLKMFRQNKSSSVKKLPRVGKVLDMEVMSSYCQRM
ncbi:hypothetical protein TNCV_4143121 [Trichonephila clavipes]|nr:hypothetical protein TNCV_4143121 [Trichonephila clavipes]